MRGRRWKNPVVGAGASGFVGVCGGERVVGDARSDWYARVGYRRTGCSAGADRLS